METRGRLSIFLIRHHFSQRDTDGNRGGGYGSGALTLTGAFSLKSAFGGTLPKNCITIKWNMEWRTER